MTLIAFATYGDHAVLVTDTMAYSARGRDVVTATKHMTLNHLDAVVATQGDSAFAIVAKLEILAGSCMSSTFDDLVPLVPNALRGAWEGLGLQDSSFAALEASVYLVGYSVSAGEFVAHRFLREHDFADELVTGLHVTPSPFTMRPQEFEVARTSEGMPDEFRDKWLAQPEPPIPADITDWGRLALRVRYERSVPNHPLKTFVGGKVIHTRIERDLVQTMTLTEYDDDGDEFAAMVSGTRHPSSQHGPCPCDSGKTLLECCMLEELDEECGCGKAGSESLTFRDCCMAPAIDPASVAIGG